MATSTFDKEFKLLNAKEANAFANAMATIVSPTLKKDFKTSLKKEEEVRSYLKEALK